MGARARLFVLSFVGMACVWLGGATGCGSVIYVNQVTRKASTSVEAAKAAEADVYAPYHYTLAVHYLRKSREEAAAADFQAANRFGRMSYKAAETARELAVERAANPRDTSWKPPPGTPGHDGTAPAPAPDGDGDQPDSENGETPSGDEAPPADAAGDGSAGEGEAPPAASDTSKDADAAKDADASKDADADASTAKPRAGRKARPKAAKPESKNDPKPESQPESQNDAKPESQPESQKNAKEDGQ